MLSWNVKRGEGAPSLSAQFAPEGLVVFFCVRFAHKGLSPTRLPDFTFASRKRRWKESSLAQILAFSYGSIR